MERTQPRHRSCEMGHTAGTGLSQWTTKKAATPLRGDQRYFLGGHRVGELMEAVQIGSGYGQSMMGQSDRCVIKELQVVSVARLQACHSEGPLRQHREWPCDIATPRCCQSRPPLLCDIPPRGAWALAVELQGIPVLSQWVRGRQD